jgi:hypothetical protein
MGSNAGNVAQPRPLSLVSRYSLALPSFLQEMAKATRRNQLGPFPAHRNARPRPGPRVTGFTVRLRPRRHVPFPELDQTFQSSVVVCSDGDAPVDLDSLHGNPITLLLRKHQYRNICKWRRHVSPSWHWPSLQPPHFVSPIIQRWIRACDIPSLHRLLATAVLLN